jgi:hypothetical protein
MGGKDSDCAGDTDPAKLQVWAFVGTDGQDYGLLDLVGLGIENEKPF